MDSFATVVNGVSVFVIGQFIIKAIIDPSRELARVIGEIAHALIFYANVYTNPGLSVQDPALASNLVFVQRKTTELGDVQIAFRKLASDMMARRHAIPFYPLCEAMKVVPKRSDILSACHSLMLNRTTRLIKGRSVGKRISKQGGILSDPYVSSLVLEHDNDINVGTLAIASSQMVTLAFPTEGAGVRACLAGARVEMIDLHP